MAVIDYEKKEVNAKIVYYGPGLSGKTSNVHFIHSKLMSQHRGELMTLSNKQHRTLFFDFLPVELGEVKGLNTRFYLYTVPGQFFYNNIRKEILKDVDGIVFVADSQAKMKNENIQSFQNLEENLSEQGRSLKEIPHIVQYNKRDMPELQGLEDLHRQLNKYGAPFFESVAINGQGVLKALTTISKMVLKRLREPDAPLREAASHEGPDEAYGLSDDFIAMTHEEALKIQKELGPQPPPEPEAAPTEPAPVPATPADVPPPEPRAEPAPATAPGPPPPASIPPRPAAPAENHPPASAPSPSAAPPQGMAPPPIPTASGGELVVSKWGNPQLTPSGIIKLPVTFKDNATGTEYSTTIAIQLAPLVPKS
jgi:signal recognition particle receptor subunit beta